MAFFDDTFRVKYALGFVRPSVAGRVADGRDGRIATGLSLYCHGHRCGRRIVSKYHINQTDEATSRGTSRLEHLTLPLMSCVGPTGRELRGGRSCGQGIGRGKGHALKSGRGVQTSER